MLEPEDVASMTCFSFCPALLLPLPLLPQLYSMMSLLNLATTMEERRISACCSIVDFPFQRRQDSNCSDFERAKMKKNDTVIPAYGYVRIFKVSHYEYSETKDKG